MLFNLKKSELFSMQQKINHRSAAWLHAGLTNFAAVYHEWALKTFCVLFGTIFIPENNVNHISHHNNSLSPAGFRFTPGIRDHLKMQICWRNESSTTSVKSANFKRSRSHCHTIITCVLGNRDGLISHLCRHDNISHSHITIGRSLPYMYHCLNKHQKSH